ncbi:hypothetical protein [Microvirga puerhi]|uniref:Uncharacterized protein n=1 Tax=Microvirga puerhi TaxID=2876078 RepID=A0ABS7VLI2_9HYPH|nr:hypothetical protein [Microvirga puerhi]MBZ6076393.1 hypothetical protein [Microvirga puerhi]
MTTEISAEMKQRAYDYYSRHPEVTIKSIALFLDISTETFYRLRRAWSWPPRAELLAPASNVAPDDETTELRPKTSAVRRSSLHEAALSLANATRSRIKALVKEQKRDATLDHDKTARTLASYAKTLIAAQALLEQESDTLDETGPFDHAQGRSIHDLRDELARHLERLVAEEEACGGDGLLA